MKKQFLLFVGFLLLMSVEAQTPFRWKKIDDVTTTLTEVNKLHGITTTGENIIKLTNPSAITFLRINANNTATLLNASDFRTAIGVGDGTGMVYPGAGIPLAGSGVWETSITNNSANWNTAYGWGNHASVGYLTTDTKWNGGSTGLNAATGRTSLNVPLASDTISVYSVPILSIQYFGTNPPTTTPLKIGDEFNDTTHKKTYKAYGISSSSDWVIIN